MYKKGGKKMSFLLSKMEKEPKIVTLESPINFVGCQSKQI